VKDSNSIDKAEIEVEDAGAAKNHASSDSYNTYMIKSILENKNSEEINVKTHGSIEAPPQKDENKVSLLGDGNLNLTEENYSRIADVDIAQIKKYRLEDQIKQNKMLFKDKDTSSESSSSSSEETSSKKGSREVSGEYTFFEKFVFMQVKGKHYVSNL
jgi:hypothetical protein